MRSTLIALVVLAACSSPPPGNTGGGSATGGSGGSSAAGGGSGGAAGGGSGGAAGGGSGGAAGGGSGGAAGGGSGGAAGGGSGGAAGGGSGGAAGGGSGGGSGGTGGTAGPCTGTQKPRLTTIATTWSLPAQISPITLDAFTDGLFSATSTCSATASQPRYSHLDLTGDGKVDLVVTKHCSDSTIGTSRWMVFPGTGTGYAANPIYFALPTGYAATTFDFLTRTAGISGGAAYTLADFTNDGKPDLVITSDADFSVGSTRWKIAANTGTTFSSTLVDFALPYTGFGFTHKAYGSGLTGGSSTGIGYCQFNENWPGYFVMDLTGDGRPDLVHYMLCNDATVGDTKWLVYPGTAAGFGAAVTFTMPTGYQANAWKALARALSACGANNLPGFTLLDVDQDAKPDLLITDNCTPTVGETTWQVHKGTGSGFAAPALFGIPAGYPASWFRYGFAHASTATCAMSADAMSYGSADLNGDGFLDVVVYDDCKDNAVGVLFWKVFPGNATGFGASYEYQLPQTQYQQGTFSKGVGGTLACGTLNQPAFTLADLTGDGKPDLVVHDTCMDNTVGGSRWLLHPATCVP